jgi:protein NrfD
MSPCATEPLPALHPLSCACGLSRGALKRGLAILWLVLLLLGLAGVYQRITLGHLPAGYGSYVPWGLWVALYFHGVGIAGGAFVIGALGFILKWPGFRHPAALRTAIIISMAGILPSFLGVWLDLGHMERAVRIFTAPSFTSMMAFNAWMYGLYLALAAAVWALSFRPQSGWLRPFLCLAGFFSVLFPSQSGAFFGVVEARPYWHTALLPMLFLTSAITSGAAVLLLVRVIQGACHLGDWDSPMPEEYEDAVGKLRIITLVGVCVYFLFEFAEFSIALWNPISHAPAIELVLFGPYWWVFWIVHLAIGGVLAVVLLSVGRPSARTLGALLVAVTFVSARLNVLVPGQAVGEIRGLQEAFHHPRLTYIYHATPMEYMVGCFMLAVGVAVFFLGERISGWCSGRTAGATGGAAG